MKARKLQGFTLIELIIVVAIIGILAAAVFVAVNPAKRIGDSNNAQRWADITAIADAWAAYVVDNTGTLPTTTDETGAGTSPSVGTTYMIATSTSYDMAHASHCTNTTTADFVVLDELVDQSYIGKLPTDPSWVAEGTGDGEGRHTQYYFYYDSGGTIIVGACETYEATGAANYEIEIVR